MGRLLGASTVVEDFDHGGAKLGSAAAAVLEQERDHITDAIEVDAIKDGSTASFGRDQASTREHAEMRRHCVVRDGEFAGDITGRHSIWFALNE
jgi:hypothetical protein